MRLRVFTALVLVAAFGCSSKPYQVAQVSGRVTLDGKPLSTGSITFAPMASKDNPNPGPTSHGILDADGRFALIFDVSTPGSVVGKCRVYITSLTANPAADERDAGGPVAKARDKVPAKYNNRTELVFDVPSGGTDQANFNLTSR